MHKEKEAKKRKEDSFAIFMVLKENKKEERGKQVGKHCRDLDCSNIRSLQTSKLFSSSVLSIFFSQAS